MAEFLFVVFLHTNDFCTVAELLRMSTYSDLDFSPSSGPDSGLKSDKSADAQELQQFLVMEQQKQEMRQQVL